jgi:putative transposase
MPRTARKIPDVGALHIVARRNNKRLLFRKEVDYKYMLSLIHEYKMRCSCLIYHYVLMPTHIHLLAGIGQDTRISKVMHGICMRYALHFNKRHGNIGHFWQNRFRSSVINDDRYMIRCGAYIEKNPVAAGLVATPEDYRWTSYRFYAFGEKNPIVDVVPFYESLGKTPEARQIAYRKMIESYIAESEASQHIAIE